MDQSSKNIEELIKKANFNSLVNMMANNDRNHWARAGYPGLRSKKCEEIIKYIPKNKLRKYLNV